MALGCCNYLNYYIRKTDSNNWECGIIFYKQKKEYGVTLSDFKMFINKNKHKKSNMLRFTVKVVNTYEQAENWLHKHRTGEHNDEFKEIFNKLAKDKASYSS